MADNNNSNATMAENGNNVNSLNNSTNGNENSVNDNTRAEASRDLGRYFLNLARQKAEEGDEESEREEEPTELNTKNIAGGFLHVEPDKLSIKYLNVNLHEYDVGAVQANKPAPMKRLVYYFEIFVKDAGQKGEIGIGFSPENFKMRRQPGWEPNSYGYLGDEGKLFRGQGNGETFGPKFTIGDTVGAGINYATQEFFFTKNGAIVGTVNKDFRGSLYPTIGVHSQNEEVLVNFGQNPFVFDLKDYDEQERMKQQTVIEKISLPANISHELVRSYLMHYGYEDTLNAFDMAIKNCTPPISIAEESTSREKHIMYALNQRKILRQLIMDGDIDAAFANIHEWFPQIVQDDKSVICFLLHCQKFIELVRAGQLEDAVMYGRAELAIFFGLEGFDYFVKDCAALLAYEKPQESSVGYLLENSQRELVADSVSSAVLSTNRDLKDSQDCLRSSLERILRQLAACCMEKSSLNGNQGEDFHLERAVDSGRKAK